MPSPQPEPTASGTASLGSLDEGSQTDQWIARFIKPGAWRVISGRAELGGSTDSTVGGAALRISYDVSGPSQVVIGATSMPPALAGLPGVVSLDVLGDRSWNVLYLQVRDATGEIFHYRLGNMGFDGWRTLSVNLRSTLPATTLWGNGDGILDLPVTPFRIVVDRGPNTQALFSSIVVDNLRCSCEPWTPLAATPGRFVASAGDTTTLRMSLHTPSAIRVVITDEAARTFTWTGGAGGGVALTRSWSGSDDLGRPMSGSLRARLEVMRPGSTFTVGIPFLGGIPARRAGTVGSIVGINSFLAETSPVNRAEAERQARLMEDARVAMAREEFDWNRVEPRKGEFNWAVFDQAVAVARSHNVELLGKLAYSASWASSAPAGTPPREVLTHPPRDLADYLRYVEAVVTRYRGEVTHWEVWNEPNLWRFWRPVRDPKAYAEMLKQTYATIKRIDPKATVVLGGLVGTDLPYLDALRQHGAWNSFDVLNIHSFVVNPPESSGLLGWLDRARAYVGRHGAKPIWLTELCWPTVAVASSSHPPVTEAQQAAYVPRAYLVSAEAGAAKVFWYSLLDHDSGSGSRYDYCGLAKADGTPKPAYEAFRQLGVALDQAVVAGPFTPGSSSRVVVNGLDTLDGWAVAGIDGGRGTLRNSPTPRFGKGALQLDYTFTAKSTGVALNANLAVAGKPTALSVWVRGDGSANPVYLSFTDAGNERYSAAIGSLQSGWQRLTLHLDGGTLNWASSGGDGNGRVDYPIRVRAVTVYRAGIGVLAGSATFDQIEAGYGPPVRGLVFARAGQNLQALYAVNPGEARIPITGVVAQLMTASGWRDVTAPTKAATLALGAVPSYLITSPEVLPATIRPSRSGGESAMFRWVSGDQSRVTLQVYALDGRLLRTLQTDVVVRGGIGSMRWDGRLRVGAGTMAAAQPGAYWLRLTMFGPDGRRAILQKKVTVTR